MELQTETFLDLPLPTPDEDTIAAVKAELEAEPLDHVARNDMEAQLFRYVRRRTGLEGEKARLKESMARMIADVDSRICGLDYVYETICMETTKSLLVGKARSIKTPYGIAGFRKKTARIVVVSEEPIVHAWELGMLPREAIKQETVTTNKPVLDILTDLYEKTGEIPEGCQLIEARDAFYVK